MTSLLQSQFPITLEQLNLLRLEFDKANCDLDSGLNLDEFVTAFGNILGKTMRKHEIVNLYMKIDVNCDGKVDWSEFMEYMLLQNHGIEKLEKQSVSFKLKKVCKS